MKREVFISLSEAKIYIMTYICEYPCFESIKDGNAIQSHIALKVSIYLYTKRSEVGGLGWRNSFKANKHISYIDVPVSFSLSFSSYLLVQTWIDSLSVGHNDLIESEILVSITVL